MTDTENAENIVKFVSQEIRPYILGTRLVNAGHVSIKRFRNVSKNYFIFSEFFFQIFWNYLWEFFLKMHMFRNLPQIIPHFYKITYNFRKLFKNSLIISEICQLFSEVNVEFFPSFYIIYTAFPKIIPKIVQYSQNNYSDFFSLIFHPFLVFLPDYVAEEW